MSEDTQVAAEAAVEEKPAAKKPAAKKTTAKKPAAKKNTAKKTSTKSSTTKKATAAKKTAASKSTARKKASAKEDASVEEQLALDTDSAQEEKPVEEAKPKKVTRSRAKKTVKVAAAADEAETTEVSKAEQGEESASAKPARKRRTTKKTVAEDTPAEEKPSEEVPKVDVVEGAEASADETAPDAQSTDETKTEGGEQDSEDTEGKDQREGKRGRRRNRRGRNGSKRKEIVPSATRDELSALEDEELIVKARELEVDAAEYGERDDLVSAVYDALLQAEGFVMVEGILDLLPDGYGFIRTDGYLPGEHDVYVGVSTVRRQGLRKGDYITGRVRPPRENEKYPALNTIVTLNDEPFEGPMHRVKFANLTPVYPDERLVLEHGKDTLTARSIDLVAPIGKGQRGLIVSPPKAGKTTVLKDVAAAISANNPEVHLMCLLVDERPEEVTDMQRSIDGEVISSTFDMPSENHIAVAELVIERAKRLVENGQDVVILLDSITRLARAYNLSQPASGRILSGGVDSTALYPPKRFLGAARNIEFGGSLTILGTALIDTGSKMDEVIFEEFKGTGNMELKLDRALADRRIFPAIDPVSSGTRKEELLLDPQEAPLVWGVRTLLANMNNTERAMKMLVSSLRATETNREFLVKSARKANKAASSL